MANEVFPQLGLDLSRRGVGVEARFSEVGAEKGSSHLHETIKQLSGSLHGHVPDELLTPLDEPNFDFQTPAADISLTNAKSYRHFNVQFKETLEGIFNQTNEVAEIVCRKLASAHPQHCEAHITNNWLREERSCWQFQ